MTRRIAYKFFSVLWISMMMIVSTSCKKPAAGDPEKGSLQVDRTEVSATSARTTENITVTADCDWGVSVEDKTWCKVSPTGGIAGTSTVKLTMEENGTGEARATKAVFTYSGGQISVPVWQNYAIEEVAIADAAFKAYLLDAFDEDNDGILSTREAATVTKIDVAGRGIQAMPEIAYAFPALEWLDCSGNRLTELNVSRLTGLKYLDCSDNALTALDIRYLLNLESLDATGNPGLTSIYVWSGFNAPAGFSKPEGAAYIEPEINTPAGYELVWSDEFNTSGESSPETSKWWYETGDGGWGNHELQDYVSSGSYNGTRIALVSDGTLKITAQEIDGKVRSVRMNTTESWTYGYFEARLKLPVGKGTWPAFWMMPKNYRTWPGDGEIDIMEHVGYHPNYVSSSIHCNSYNHVKGTQKTNEIYLSGANAEFHTYALEWTKDYMNFIFDGKVHFTFRNDGTGNYDTWPFDNPFYLKLNLAWGGDWGGAQGIDESCLPVTYEIDYVRVFKKVE